MQAAAAPCHYSQKDEETDGIGFCPRTSKAFL